MRLFLICALFVVCMLSVATVTAQEEKDDLSIRFPVAMEDFSLTVVDSDGNAIVGAEVLVGGVRCKEDRGSWYTWPAINGGPMPIVLTDQYGVASFEYPTKLGRPGGYFTITTLTMTFRHADFISERAEVAVGEEEFEQVLQPGCRVTYSAVDRFGQPIEKFGAYISGPGYNAKWTLAEGTIQSSAVPDGAWQTMLVAPQDDGITLFSGILPARYRSGNDVTIRNVTLSPGLRVQGRLSDDVPRPVSDGVVVAWSQPKPTETALKEREAIGWMDSATIGEDGTFEIPSLPRGGRLQLIALCRGWVIKDQPRDGQLNAGQIKRGVLIDLASANIAENLLADVELPMEPTGALEVKVKHLDGRPAEGIQVGTSPNQMLEDTGTQLLGASYPSIVTIQSRIAGTEAPNYWQRERKTRYMQETDAEGRAMIHDLPLGSWGIYIGSDEFKLVPEENNQEGEENRNRLYPEINVDVMKPETHTVQATVAPLSK